MSSRVCLLLLLVTGCRRDADERLGLDEKRVYQPPDPSVLAREGELEKAVSVPAAEVLSRMGAYRFNQSAHLAIGSSAAADKDRKDDFEQSWKLELDGKGGIHTLVENSHDYGFETVVSSGQVYARPRYGRFAPHSPEGDELERVREGVQGVLSGYLAVLGRFAARTDEGEATTAGRKVRRIKLSLASSPSRLRDTDPSHAWRQTIKVSALEGSVDVDVQTGAPLHATLDATWSSQQPPPPGSGSTAPPLEVTVKLAYRGDVDQIGQVAAISPPEGPLTPAVRSRPLVERNTLLEGLATPNPQLPPAAPASNPTTNPASTPGSGSPGAPAATPKSAATPPKTTAARPAPPTPAASPAASPAPAPEPSAAPATANGAADAP